MAEEEVIASAIDEGTAPPPSDHKRKFDDLEPEQASQQPTTAPTQCHDETDNNSNSVANLNADDAVFAVSEDSDAKRLRLDDMPDGSTVIENGHQAEKVDEAAVKDVQEHVPENVQREDTKDIAQEEAITTEEAGVKKEDSENESQEAGEGPEPPSVENPELEITDKSAVDEVQQPSDDILCKEDVAHAEQDPTSDKEITRKMEVPNNKVGVLIGKAGDTIRMLQHNSGVLIQIMRDLDADPSATTRPVELTGSLESINKAEKLIRDVIAEADAGGSPALVARGFSTVQAAGAVEKIEIQVPNEKVGLIIGRGGETIKGLQTRSGARIQLIPQHLPDGDQSKERTVRVSGDKMQIELAKELMDEVMSQTVRASSLSTGYNQQQGNRARGHGGNSQWGPRGPNPAQPAGYDYQHRGPYQSHQNSQYPPQQYGNYPQHNLAPRSSFGGGWDHRPPQSGGYDYYGGQGHLFDGPASAPRTSAVPSQGPGLSPAPTMGPHTQPNYNYNQTQGPEYGQPAPYSTVPTQQGYGYENQAPTQISSYGGHASSQSAYPQAPAAQGVYGQQHQYARPPPPYAMPMQQGPPPQSYGPPRAPQVGDYQGPVSSTQSYGQQPYPYISGGQMPQSSYPAYGSQPAGDGYNQPQPASGPAFPQQGGQPPVQGYAQGVPAPAGYAAYPSQQDYTEQSAQNNAGFGFQATGPVPAYGAPPGSQPVYPQQPQAQTGYDQSGGYASVPR